MAAKRARPFAELTVDPVVLDRLRAVEPDLGPATTVRTTDRELASRDVPREVSEAAVAALARPSASADRRANAARLVVRGRVGSGRRTPPDDSVRLRMTIRMGSVTRRSCFPIVTRAS
jgi:hypothetical protein